MFMAPDSWQGLYYSTLEHAKSGRIPAARLDDAVRRILRVKLTSGVFEAPKPSLRPLAGKTDILGSAEHRAIARQAVRESMVLLKNENNLLPLDGRKTILVVGDGADSITKAAGGWTLSWQGGGYPNSEFPNGESILSGIRSAVGAKGGKLIFDPTGSANVDADVVIAVYGEDPYAEFQGDVDHVDFVPNGFDTAKLKAYKDSGKQVVSVFLSGRPMWTNPEINASDAFVAAFLPGSEGAGIADVLFQTDPTYDFKGRLSFSWPKTADDVELNVHNDDYDALFAFGYGLSYGDASTVGTLSEVSGIDESAMATKGLFFAQGKAPQPWMLTVNETPISGLPFDDGNLTIAALDKDAQEDSLRVGFTSGETDFVISSGYGHDFSRESNGAMELVFSARSLAGSTDIMIGMGCDSDDGRECAATLPVTLSAEWQEVRLTLSCFAERGVEMGNLGRAMIIDGDAGQSVGLSNVRIEADTNAKADCGHPG